MNRKKLFVSNKRIIKTQFQKLSSSLHLVVFETHNLYIMWFSNLLQARLWWMPSVCYIPSYYLQNCVYLYLVPLLLHGIGNLLAYKAALFVTYVCRLLIVLGREDMA